MPREHRQRRQMASILTLMALMASATFAVVLSASASAQAGSPARSAECFSKAEYNKIKKGMTKRQVVRIIGTDADYYYTQGTKRVGQWLACSRGPHYVVFSRSTKKMVDKSTGPCYRTASHLSSRC